MRDDASTRIKRPTTRALRARPSQLAALASLTLALASCSSEAAEPIDAPGRYDRVILITIDTLRADHLAPYGYLRQTSPFIDSLAERGVLFDQAVSTMSHTAPSHSSIFTGLLPLQHGVLKNGDILSNSIPTIASEYRRAGYATGAFTSNKFLKRTTAGFDEVDADLRQGDDTIDKALDWIDDNGDRPLFVWIHFFDVHEAEIEGFEPPSEHYDAIDERTKMALPELYEALAELHGLEYASWRGEFPEMRWEADPKLRATHLATREEFLASIREYDAEIAFVDSLLFELHEELEELDPNAANLWVVTSDHGEGLGNHGYRGHDAHIYQAQLHVPLIFHATDGSLPARRIEEQVSLVDVFPTLIEALGDAARAIPPVEGISLWPALATDPEALPARPIYAQKKPMPVLKNSQYTVIENRQKYILHTAADRRHEFYDLADDPRELTNEIARSDSDAYRERLEAKLAELHQNRASTDAGDGSVPPEILAELEALGYIGSEDEE